MLSLAGLLNGRQYILNRMRSDPILAAFAQRRSRQPHAPLTLGSRHRTSVSDVDALRQTTARLLVSSGVRTGTLVALAAVNGPGFLGTFLGLRQAGCPVLLLDWRTPPAEKQRIAHALGCSAVLHCQHSWPRHAKDLVLEQAARRNIRSGSDSEPRRLDPDIAVVKLTSGSTGTPRGILTPAEALVADDASLAASMDLRPDERILSSVPMSHSYGLSSVVMPALVRDAVLITPEEDNPLAPLKLAAEQQATFLPTVPAFLQALLKRQNPPPLPPSLRRVISAGALLRPDTAALFRQVYDLPVHVFYGASEAGGITYDRDGGAAERGTLGTPIEGVELRLDPVARNGNSTVQRGTVTVTSPAVASGYLEGTAETTQDQLCRQPTSSEPPTGDQHGGLHGGSFYTRDLASLRDGELVLEGRLDDLINVKGKKVNPREVEAVLSHLEGVEEAIVLGVPRPNREGHLVRAFVAGPPETLTYEVVQAWCRRHLAEHKVPRSILLLKSIPRTSRGKLDRAALLALAPLVRRG